MGTGGGPPKVQVAKSETDYDTQVAEIIGAERIGGESAIWDCDSAVESKFSVLGERM